jgi:hypothetical protein
VLAIGWLLLVAPAWRSYDWLAADDAGYYFHIARNALLGHGFSFDRLALTNGFNPLFPSLLIPLYRLFGDPPAVLVAYRLGVGMSVAAMVVAGVTFVRWIRDALPADAWTPARRRLAAATVAVVWAFFMMPKAYYGLDAPLVLMFGLLWLRRVQRHGLLGPGVRAAVIDGILLAALFLSRVDTLPLLVAAFGLMALAAPGRAGAWRAIAWRAAAVAACVAPFVAWALTHFGTWVPISARLKTSFPRLDPAASLAVIRGAQLNAVDLTAFALAWVIAVAIALRMLPRVFGRERHAVLDDGARATTWVLASYLAMRLTYLALFSRLDVQGSYAILAHMFLAWCAFAALTALLRRAGDEAARGRIAGVACAVAVAIATLLLAGKTATLQRRWAAITPGGAGDMPAFAAAIHDATRPDDVLYGGAFGLLGFFSDRAWINGDGVANDHDYQLALRDDDLAGYLAARGVTHIAYLDLPGTLGADGRVHLRVASHLYGTIATLVFPPDPAPLRGWTARGGGAHIVIARYDAATAASDRTTLPDTGGAASDTTATPEPAHRP